MTMTAGHHAPDSASYDGPVTAGIGCSSRASSEEIIALVSTTLDAAGIRPGQLVALGAHRRKHASLPLHQAARHFGVPLHLLVDDNLVPDVPNPSARVARAIGLPGVAEAVALAAGALLAAKHKSAHATCALGAGDLMAPAQPSSPSAAIASSRLATSSAGP